MGQYILVKISIINIETDLQKCLPSRPFPKEIGSPSSLLHVTVGFGDPLAAHLRLTLEPSLTTISALVG